MPTAQTFGTLGPDHDMTQLAGVRIGAPVDDFAAWNYAAADACRKRHVEQRAIAAPRSVERFTQSAHIGVVIHHRQQAQRLFQVAWKIEIAPSADMRGERDSLPLELHWAPESNPAALKLVADRPLPGDVRDL